MHFNNLTDLALHEILVKLDAQDIKSLHNTNRRLFRYIRANRLHYKRHRVSKITVSLKDDGTRDVEVEWRNKDRREMETHLGGEVDQVVKSLSPRHLISYDYEELANMGPLWWKGITGIVLTGIVDYRRYLPHLGRCTYIELKSDFPINLTEVLSNMEQDHLAYLSVAGRGEHELTDDDLRKIGRLSDGMEVLEFAHFSESTNISSDAILDMIEIGSFSPTGFISVPRIQDDMLEAARRRSWVTEIKQEDDESVEISNSDGLSLYIEWGKDRYTSYDEDNS